MLNFRRTTIFMLKAHFFPTVRPLISLKHPRDIFASWRTTSATVRSGLYVTTRRWPTWPQNGTFSIVITHIWECTIGDDFSTPRKGVWNYTSNELTSTGAFNCWGSPSVAVLTKSWRGSRTMCGPRSINDDVLRKNAVSPFERCQMYLNGKI